MSELLAKHTVSFLQMLNRLLKLPQTDTSFIACLALLFEYQNSGELDAHAWCPLGPQGEVDIEDLSKRLGEHLQLSSSTSQYNVSAATSLPGSRMRAVLEDDSLSDGGSSASGACVVVPYLSCQVNCSVAVIAEISVRLPRKLFIKTLYWEVLDLSKRLGEHLQLSSSTSQYNVSTATSLPGSRMRAVLEDDSLSDGDSSASGAFLPVVLS